MHHTWSFPPMTMTTNSFLCWHLFKLYRVLKMMTGFSNLQDLPKLDDVTLHYDDETGSEGSGSYSGKRVICQLQHGGTG